MTSPSLTSRRAVLIRIGFCMLGLRLVAAIDAAPVAKPQGLLPGQIIIDPEYPKWLKRNGGGHVFICGPGDPEGFLYRGQRNPDGTRSGDQSALIEKLIRHGGNCIYMQIVRTHGGDAEPDATQNPFRDSDPAKGLDHRILDQWEQWFTRMDEHGILIYLFFYDDGARLWDTGDMVGAEEQAFVEGIVRKFQHHTNLIWLIGEESEERYSHARVNALAGIIRRTDAHGHVIGNHHLNGTVFKAWRPDSALNHFSMQFGATGDAAHAVAVEALRQANGRYQIIYSESTATPNDVRGMRTHAWAVAMGGVMPMILGMDIATTPAELLRQCRHLQQFFEATDYYTMSPHDELKHAETRYVLADPGRSYIAYADRLTGGLGVKSLPAGRCFVTWLDCRTGTTVVEKHDFAERGDRTLRKPPRLGDECAAWIRFPEIKSGEVGARAREAGRRATRGENEPPLSRAAEFPGDAWPTARPSEVDLSEARLQQARDYALTGGGSGLILRHGKVVISWGDQAKLYDLKSTSKSIGVTVLGLALKDGKVQLDDRAIRYQPELGATPESNKATGWLDQITLRQLANQTAGFEKPGGYGRLLFAPGTKWHYSDAGPNWLAECLTLVYGRDLDEVMFERVFTPIGIKRTDIRWRNNAYRPHEISGVKRREFGSGFHANVRAMARIGYLYLREGRWKDQQIIPADFVKLARQPAKELLGLPEHEEGHGDASEHYGLLWWNNGDGTIRGLPRDAYWSWGLYESLIVVIPSLDIVVSRAGQSWGPRERPRRTSEEHYSVLRPFLEPIAQAARAGQGGHGSSIKPSGPPYPPSPVIKGVTWAPKSEITRRARGGDNWPMTWGDDDVLYTAYGDGNGFAPFVPAKLSVGFSKVIKQEKVAMITGADRGIGRVIA